MGMSTLVCAETTGDTKTSVSRNLTIIASHGGSPMCLRMAYMNE